ncbi:unnamed protein product [Sphenostylis stenocarpa]|uniref:Uncharacterized protein n=1 Tax=Sphenostylis stenocarpa TaxID=92480 RepID=A0AA86SWK2_9FABA|nr:unnamed protein product [Sphenostylis stenocarpa]
MNSEACGRKGHGPMAPTIPLDTLFAGLSQNTNSHTNTIMGPFASISSQSPSNKRMRAKEAKNFGWGRTLTEKKTMAQEDSHADAVA